MEFDAMKKPGDWWPCYSIDTTEAKVKEKAAKALDVPEDAVEVKRTDGCWLARERQENED